MGRNWKLKEIAQAKLRVFNDYLYSLSQKYGAGWNNKLTREEECKRKELWNDIDH